MNSKELQNITMSTGGAYSLATRGAQDVINAAIPMVEEALLKMDLEQKKNFSFVLLPQKLKIFLLYALNATCLYFLKLLLNVACELKPTSRPIEISFFQGSFINNFLDSSTL